MEVEIVAELIPLCTELVMDRSPPAYLACDLLGESYTTKNKLQEE
jgi:hypothetical protein